MNRPFTDHDVDHSADAARTENASHAKHAERATDAERTEGTPGRPRAAADDARAFVAEHFGIQGDFSELPSDRDQNLLVTCEDGKRYVFKISNADTDPSTLEAQEQALQHLRSHNLPVPTVMPTITEDVLAQIELPSGTHLARLVSYVQGAPLAQMRPKTEHVLYCLGEMMGEIDHSLADFAHPATDRKHEWDIIYTHEAIEKYSSMVDDPPRRQLMEDFRGRFVDTVLPMLADLPRQVIHGDANDHNVLVSDFEGSGRDPAGGDRSGGTAGATPDRAPDRASDRAPDRTTTGKPVWTRTISGVIDFGDLIHTIRIAELAICAAYAMTNTTDPIAALGSVTAGYHHKSPLSEEEINVLFDLIRARLFISVAFSAKQKRDEPENDYLTISEEPAWKLLEFIAPYSTELATYCIRAACGMEPFPGNRALVSWLEEHRESFHPVVRPDPRSCSVNVFDFSVGTLDWKPTDMMEPQVAGEKMFRYLSDKGAEIGVGRYDEARLVYGGKQFEEFGSKNRTVHIGLDLFQHSGSPVFAPLPGKVFSVQSNIVLFDYGPVVVLEHTPEGGPIFYTLYGHLSVESVKDLRKGRFIEAGQQFACLGTPDENGGWVPHLHVQIIGDMMGSDGNYIGVALSSQRAVWKSLCPDPNLLIGIPESAFPAESLSTHEIRKRRSAVIGPSLSLSYEVPLHFVRGYMQNLYNADGEAYLDAVNNVSHVGHSHPRVGEAASRQMAALNTNTRYLHENPVVYAERLAATMPDPLNIVFIVNSGSEANDLALRLARAATGGTDVITVEGAYHGNLSSLIDISPYKYGGPGGRGTPPRTMAVPMPDPYRGLSGSPSGDPSGSPSGDPIEGRSTESGSLFKGMSAESGRAYAQFVENAATKSENLSAFICESVLGCGGQIFLPDAYLKNAFAAVRNQGGVCITDEIQVGLGRLGSHFWGFQTHDVIPDIVTVGKPVGNGFPLGAVVTTREIADAFNNGMEYFNTFGGNPVSCAVGLAVLDVIEDEKLQENADKVGAHLLGGLKLLAEKHPLIGDVRGQGLFLGIELVRDPETLAPAADEASYLVNRLCEERILTSTDGPLHNVIKIKPPLVFTVEDADHLLSQMASILTEDFLRV